MREWLNSILGQDGGRVAQFALALIAVVLLILLLGWVVQRLRPAARFASATGGKARKRLGVIEASDVDARRRLVLVRRDDVEHLIMIGGPNDLLVESRILRSGQVANRPNIQQMPRPAEADRPVTAPVRTIVASDPIPAPLPQPAPQETMSSSGGYTRPSLTANRPPQDEEPALPPVAAAPLPELVAPPPFVPPTARPTAQVAPSQPTAPVGAEMRRPSLSDLLAASAAAKNGERRDLPRPIAAPPPMPRLKPQLPDLEDDDRELPTQIVSYRPPAPPVPDPIPAPAPPARVEPVESRQAEVTTQIERALADLHPVAATPLPSSPGDARMEPSLVPPTLSPLPRRPAPMPALTRPVPPSPAVSPSGADESQPATMPPIPPRPVPPVRAFTPERMPVPVRPLPAERAEPAFVEDAASEGGDAAASTRPSTAAPVFAVANDPAPAVFPPAAARQASVSEPATAPRPILTPNTQASAAQPLGSRPANPVEPEAVAPALNTPKARTDALEEEMAKLLSELGGTTTR